MKRKKRIRFLFAVLTAKGIAFCLKILGRNATHLPGAIALKLCDTLFTQLEKPKTLICVTGTNGKTTTANLIASMLRKAGKRVTNNSLGSNTAAGIASALLTNASFTGKSQNPIAVIEVDERSSLLFYPYMTPDYLVCTNIMPDSILRNAHTDFISYILNAAVPSETKVILNADDVIGGNLAPQCKTRIYFGIEAEPSAPSRDTTVKNMVYCPVCGEKMEAQYLRYEHIGRCRCPSCGYGTPKPDYAITSIQREAGMFTLRKGTQSYDFPIVNDNIVNLYNTCAAAALFFELGYETDAISALLAEAEIVRNRYEILHAGDLRITMLLAKGLNSVAVGSVFRYIASLPGDDKCLLLLIDDREYNRHDSEICCWLYDLDYSPLNSAGITQIIFAGKRCYDHRLRTEMEGLDQTKIQYTLQVDRCSSLIDTRRFHDVYILYSAYFIGEAMRERDRLLRRGELEK